MGRDTVQIPVTNREIFVRARFWSRKGEKSFTKCEREDIPRLYKKSKLSLSLDQQYKRYTDCFHCISKSRSTEIYQAVFVRYQKVGTKKILKLENEKSF